MKLLAIPALLLAAMISTPAQAKLKVFACEPEWGSLVHELAGDKVDVDVATSALQDVHVIEAKPSLIAKVRSADLVVCTGAELEVGWLPQLIKQSGNSKVASGAGYFMAAPQVKMLEKPTALDRANGDVHPDGNPHVQLDPRRVLVIAKALDARLVQLDPANAATYQQRFTDFNTRWLAAMVKWKAEAAPLGGRGELTRLGAPYARPVASARSRAWNAGGAATSPEVRVDRAWSYQRDPSNAVTVAPARSAISPAAAMSHADRPLSWTKASNRPFAT